MKKTKFFKGLSLDEWVENNKLEYLRDQIECHCEVYLQDPRGEFNWQEVRCLTRLILISVRDALE